MPEDKYPSIFSSQMETIVFIILQIFYATRAVLKIGVYINNRHFKIEVSRQPQTSKCHVTSRLPSGLPFAVHVSTSGDLSCGK